MKKTCIYIAVVILMYSCQKELKDDPVSPLSEPKSLNIDFNFTHSQFGVLVNAAYADTLPAYGRSEQYTLDQNAKLDLYAEYGVKNIRLSVNKTLWANAKRRDKFLSFFKALFDSDFSTILNINYNVQTSVPLTFPDPYEYRAFMEEVLDSISNRSSPGKDMKPTVVVVLNEEFNPSYFDLSGETVAIDNYVNILKQATAVCKSRSIAVTNGGVVCALSAYLTWDWLKTRYDASTANKWAATVFPDHIVSQLKNGLLDPLIAKGKYAMFQYSMLELSYINIHWYEPVIVRYWPSAGNPYSAPYNVNPSEPIEGGLDSVVRYFNTTLPSLKVITNETGLLTYEPHLLESMVNRYSAFYTAPEKNFPIVCFYDGDDNENHITGAKALHNAISTSQYTLRGTGQRFRKKID